jgi:hypothetical protein
VGLFKNLGDSFASMNQNIANAPVVEANAMAMMQGQAIDPSAPQWAPIHGVDLDRYTWLYVETLRQKFPDAQAAETWLASQGVVAGTWGEINSGWQQRMAAHMDVMTRYGVLSSQYGIHTV